MPDDEEDSYEESMCKIVATFRNADREVVGVLADVDCGHIELLVPDGQDSEVTGAVCSATEHLSGDICKDYEDVLDDGAGTGRDEAMMGLPKKRFVDLTKTLNVAEF